MYTQEQIELGNQRLLNAARALRESSHPERFTMKRFVHSDESSCRGENWCGSPACVLGHYAARSDIQDAFKVQTTKVKTRDGEHDRHACIRVIENDSLVVCPSDTDVCDHFAVARFYASELFDSDGCGNARSTIEAARYIEAFVARRAVQGAQS